MAINCLLNSVAFLEMRVDGEGVVEETGGVDETMAETAEVGVEEVDHLEIADCHHPGTGVAVTMNAIETTTVATIVLQHLVELELMVGSTILDLMPMGNLLPLTDLMEVRMDLPPEDLVDMVLLLQVEVVEDMVVHLAHLELVF